MTVTNIFAILALAHCLLFTRIVWASKILMIQATKFEKPALIVNICENMLL